MTDLTEYADGNVPQAGDLISFGTRHMEFIVTSIDWDPPALKIHSGTHVFENYSLQSMILIARHGESRGAHHLVLTTEELDVLKHAARLYAKYPVPLTKDDPTRQATAWSVSEKVSEAYRASKRDP